VGCMWPMGGRFDLAGLHDMRLEKMLHNYLTWVAGDPVFFWGKNLFFSMNFTNGNTWCV